MTQKRPDSVNVMGVQYTIEYVNNPAEVDLYKRESLWGQIDYWTRTIRVYDNGRSDADVWETIIHETLHGIIEALKLKSFNKDHDDLDVLALGITDVFFRNGWLIFEEANDERQI